jgi:UDP:flavonoid glycosyltransferase YjiC (YdhE family)
LSIICPHHAEKVTRGWPCPYCGYSLADSQDKPMRIIMLALGTWGDVRPYAVLGQALQDEGYDVLLLAAKEFRSWVEARNIPFCELVFNLQEMLDTLMNSAEDLDRNVLAATRFFREKIGPGTAQLGKQVADVVRPGDALLCVEIATHLLHGIVEKYDLRLLLASLFPTIPSAEYLLFNLPAVPDWMPARGIYNRVSGQFLRRLTWSLLGVRGNQIRTDILNLPKRPWRLQRAALEAAPHLLLVSPHVVPKPGDWPTPVQVTGYLFDDDPAWEPPQDCLDFLAAGEPPVYIGFGSMLDKDSKTTTSRLLESLEQAEQRAVILSGWAGLGSDDLPENVFSLKYAPHSWLFPRMAAVVHHGGAGTTAAGLRAGVPSIVVPNMGDQLFWGRRTYELGVGTQPIPKSSLTVGRLVEAIHTATSDTAMHARCVELGRKIAAENGVDTAVKVIRDYLH